MDAVVFSEVQETNTNVTGARADISALNSNVGSNADASSAAGSVHAKLKDIRSAIPTLQKVRGTINGKLSISSDTLTTVLSLSGPGSLQMLACRKYTNTTNPKCVVKVILDGEIKILSDVNNSTSFDYLTVQSFTLDQSAETRTLQNIGSSLPPQLSLDFKTSLVMEFSYGTICWIVSKE